MSIYISNGNRRMDIPTFSIPAVKTCKGSTEHCREYCYAKKAERLWKNPRESRKRNLKETKKESFVEDCTKVISKIKNEHIRIHESGDFYSQEYLNKWIKIMNNLPDKKFLIFTQRYDLNWDELPNNCVRYWSVWDDTKNPPKYGLKAYVIDDGTSKINHNEKTLKLLKNVKECAKGKGSDLKCDDCMWCYNGNGDVKFKLH